MTVNDFHRNLISNGYIGNPTGVQDVYAFQSPLNYERHLVVTLTEEFDFWGAQMNMEAIQRDLSYRFSTNKILFVIFTSDTVNARVLTQGSTYCWLYNTVTNAVEIYERQPYEFFNIKPLLIGEIKATKKKQTTQFTIHKVFNFTNLLILINVIIHIGLMIGGDLNDLEYMIDNGALYVDKILEGQVFRFFTSMFMHFDWSHILGNMFVLFLIGRNLENMVGKWKFLIIYMVSGLGGGIVAAAYYFLTQQNVVCAGASGAVYGIAGGLIWALIINIGKGRKFVLWQVIAGVALSIGQGFNSAEGVSVSAHIGGFIFGFLISLIICRRSSIKSNED